MVMEDMVNFIELEWKNYNAMIQWYFFLSKQWDKKVHMLENNGFLGKTMGFGGKQCFFKKQCFFDTTSHMIYFDYKAYAFYQNKNYSCFT